MVFHPLAKEQIRSIVDLMLGSVSQQLREKEIKLEVTEAAKDFLGEKGYDEVFGARPLRRVIQDMVEDKLSEAVLREEFKTFSRVFETEVAIKKAEIIPPALKAAGELPDVIATESSDKVITVYAMKSVKFDLEKIVKDQVKELLKDEPEGKTKDKEATEPKITENSYVSYVIIDIKNGEIVIKSKGSFTLPSVAVGAATG